MLGCGLAGTRDLISFLKIRHVAGQPVAGHSRTRSAGACRRADASCVTSSIRASTRTSRAGASSTASSIRSAARAADRSTTASARRRATRCSSSTSCFRSISSRSPTDRRPIRRRGVTDSLLARAERTGTAPKVFHLLTNSEYFNRAGSLVHTDPTGTQDADLPANTRVYMIASAPHGPGPFPPASNRGGGMVGRAALNPLELLAGGARAVSRARSLGRSTTCAPPPSAYPRIADGTLTSPDRAGWPAIPGYQLPQQPLRAFHLNFGADWAKGIVSVEPPEVGKPFVVRVPAVDARRQRARRHPAAGHRGAAGDAGRLELSRRVDRRARSAGRRDRLVHPVRAHDAPTASAPTIRGCRSRSATATATNTSASSPRRRSISCRVAICFRKTWRIC